HGIDGKYADLVKLLKDAQLSQATKGQATVQQDLNRLLDLLVSGDRDKQIPNERAEVKRFIERINKLIREQQGVQGETEGQGDSADLAKRQQDIAEKTGNLSRDIDKFENRNNPGARSGENPQGQPGDNADGKGEDSGNPDAQNPDGKDAKSGGKSNGKN